MAGRWIIVSNRLPVAWQTTKQQYILSSGGLVSAISGIHTQQNKLWVGSIDKPADCNVEITDVSLPLAENIQLSPISIDPKIYDQYYNGYCNQMLWPLFHDEIAKCHYDANSWKAYQQVNQQFADHIATLADSSDLIWVHDFHLMLLPAMLKEQRPDLTVGFFLHIPFPCADIFKVLPQAKMLLSSLLTTDLVGFHLMRYLQNYRATAAAVVPSRSIGSAGVFPASIDTEKFLQVRQKEKHAAPAVKNIYFKDEIFSFLGVDRLDYIKGLDLKLSAYEQYLNKHSEMHGKVQLVQLVVPSRTKIAANIKLRQHIENKIQQINDKFSTPSWQPICYLYDKLTFQELCVCYQQADAILVTSKRDGLNLVCLEYLASHDKTNPGAVIVSEFAGVATFLQGSFKVNPWDNIATADAMHRPVTQSLSDKRLRWEKMQQFILKHNATSWANSFMQNLASMQKQTSSLPEAQFYPAEKIIFPTVLRNLQASFNKISL